MKADVEGGFNFERETNYGPNVDTVSLPGLELRLGVLEGVELQLAADGFVQEWRDAESNSNGVSFPTGSGFNTSDGYDPEFEFLYAWDIGERWNVNGNFDFASVSLGEDDSQRHFLFRPESTQR